MRRAVFRKLRLGRPSKLNSATCAMGSFPDVMIDVTSRYLVDVVFVGYYSDSDRMARCLTCCNTRPKDGIRILKFGNSFRLCGVRRHTWYNTRPAVGMRILKFVSPLRDTASRRGAHIKMWQDVSQRHTRPFSIIRGIPL